tara:strand:- start:4890 stop:5471 length:582 start_codon:yes stop_codon:yes gene_type:complete
MKLNELYGNVLNEYLEDDFRKHLPRIEDMFGVEVIKTLGESSGVAYLTSDNKVLKITSSDGEVKVSGKLMGNPSKYFPEIYKMEKLTNNGWYVILKEFIPTINDNIKKIFKELDSYMSEWAEHKYPDELTSHKLIDVRDTGFMDFLNEEEPHLVQIYTDLNNIQQIASEWVEILDIHEDNFGWKNNHLVLFDY